MTIAEFIKHLQTLPQDAEVVSFNGSTTNPGFNRVTGLYDLNNPELGIPDPGTPRGEGRPVYAVDDGGSDTEVPMDEEGRYLIKD
jgi:hypothetical protein